MLFIDKKCTSQSSDPLIMKSEKEGSAYLKMSSVDHQGVGKGMTLMTSFVPTKQAGALVYNIVGTSKHDVITAAPLPCFEDD